MKKFPTLALMSVFTVFAAIAQTPAPLPNGRATQGKPAQSRQQQQQQQQTPPQTPPPGAPASVARSAGAAFGECGCEGEALPEVIAVVNGVKIVKQDVDAQTKKQIDELHRSVIEARRQELDLQINSRLLEAEAKKRGTTTTKLLEAEIVAKLSEPTEAEAQTFYDANKSNINRPFAEVKANVIAYLRDQRQREEAKKFADKLRATSVVKILAPAASPPANDAERARVLAVVNGEQLTSGQIEESLKPLIYSVQERVYQLRKNEVELRINDVLLEQEAQKRRLTTKALFEAEIDAKLKPVTEAEARTFYDQNKERINGEFALIKDQINQYLQDTQRREMQAAFAGLLRKGAALQINLRAPEPPVLQIAVDDQPFKGNPAAPVTIVEFTDFQCPSCALAQPIIEKLAAEYGDRVRLVVRDFPLAQHEFAPKAAEAAEAARAQGKYWEYAALLFTNQKDLSLVKLKEYATQVGLDRQKFDAMLDSGQFAEKVQRDMLDGVRLGVNSTPTFYVNGRIASDRSYEGLKTAIEKALGEKSKK